MVNSTPIDLDDLRAHARSSGDLPLKQMALMAADEIEALKSDQMYALAYNEGFDTAVSKEGFKRLGLDLAILAQFIGTTPDEIMTKGAKLISRDQSAKFSNFSKKMRKMQRK